MVPHHSAIDPFSPETNYFECVDCGNRTPSNKRLTTCEDCGGTLQNIAVPRE